MQRRSFLLQTRTGGNIGRMKRKKRRRRKKREKKICIYKKKKKADTGKEKYENTVCSERVRYYTYVALSHGFFPLKLLALVVRGLG